MTVRPYFTTHLHLHLLTPSTSPQDLHFPQTCPRGSLKRRLVDSSRPNMRHKRTKPSRELTQPPQLLPAWNSRDAGIEPLGEAENVPPNHSPGLSTRPVSGFPVNSDRNSMPYQLTHGDHVLAPSNFSHPDSQVPDSIIQESYFPTPMDDFSLLLHGDRGHGRATTAEGSNAKTGGHVHQSDNTIWLGFISPNAAGDAGMAYTHQQASTGSELYNNPQDQEFSAIADDFVFVDYQLNNAFDSNPPYDGLATTTTTTESNSNPPPVDEEEQQQPQNARLSRTHSSDSSSWSDIVPRDDSTSQESSSGRATGIALSSGYEGRAIAPRQKPRTDSGSSSSRPKRRPRGQFRTLEKREETSETRRLRACVRCRIQRVRVRFSLLAKYPVGRR